MPVVPANAGTHMWTAPCWQEAGCGCDRSDCGHMSGLLMRSHMTAAKMGSTARVPNIAAVSGTNGSHGVFASLRGRRLAYLQPHAVIGGNHAVWQALTQHLVIDVRMHVGDDGAARLDALDPGQRVGHAEMAGMRGIAQAVDDPEIEIFEQRP